jgi:threonine/homoserine/homoserine lactone efflux protein
MTKAIVEGVFLGITLSFLVGPTFISLIQTSIHRGFYAGVQFAIGVTLSDIGLIALSYLGLLQIYGSDQQYLTLGIIGGFILIGFGIITFYRNATIPKHIPLSSRIKTGRLFKYISKGFVLNILNPFLLIFWVGVMGLVSAKYYIPSREVHFFFTGCIATVFSTDVFKVIVSRRIRNYLNVKKLKLLNRIAGSMLMLFGVILILRVLFFL